jgi:hypothetical protein
MAPASDAATAQSRTLTTSAANLTLAAGFYELHLDASAGMAMGRLGGTNPTLPTDGDVAQTGFWLAPGVPKSLLVESEQALRALMTIGTGTLYITRLR